MMKDQIYGDFNMKMKVLIRQPDCQYLNPSASNSNIDE